MPKSLGGFFVFTMAPICNLDIDFADQIAAPLMHPSLQEVQAYFDELVATRQCNGLEVKHDGEFGKGVYANLEFREGELVLKDQMLFGVQHTSNKVDCLVCSFCFQFIGSIELQIGRKLYLQDLGFSPNSERDTFSHSYASKDCYKMDPSNEDASFMADHDDSGACPSIASKERIPIPREIVEALRNSELVLPYSKQFSLPSAIPCPGGCGEEHYCSKLCADADWELFHSLLCTGKKSESVTRQSLVKFVEHANETNDIFLLAAKAIAFTITKYKELKAAHVEEQKQDIDRSGLKTVDFSLLLRAWKPFSMGHKRRWWDCITLPDDVESDDEASFRMHIRELAFTSLQFLKEAIFDVECAPLFSLEIYGHIIGMFELNNLDLVVASPVEDYFLYIDGLPYPEREEAEQITGSILDALGEDYSICCQGTAFFPLQSCMNHSCCPNAKAFKRDEDRDGQATIIALRPISKREEITISYIDENLSFRERRALLADYGFRCRCPKCLEEITISYIDENLSFRERRALLADYGFRCRCPKCLEEGS